MENMEKQPKKFHSDNMEAVRKFFYGINWTTFYQEKMALQETRELILNAEDTPKNINAVKWIDGVLNMMDAMGDVAEQIGLFVYPERDNNDRCFDDRYNDVLAKDPEAEGQAHTPQTAKNTRVAYLYRDGANYKKRGIEVVSGAITAEQCERIKACLIDGEYFYPSKVGLPEHRFDTIYEGDPDWYELCVEDDLTLTDEMPTVGLTVDQLVENFEAAKSIC